MTPLHQNDTRVPLRARRLLAGPVRNAETRPHPPLLLTVSEVAEILRTTNKAVYAMVERGQLDGAVRRIRRRVLFDQAALVAWLAEQSGAPSPEGDRR